jgi:hypothetical protein
MDAKLVSAIEATRRRDDSEMPFQSGIRVACPMQNFNARKTIFCLSCDMFQGVYVKGHVGEPEGNDAEKASKLTMIRCAHPIARKLGYFRED